MFPNPTEYGTSQHPLPEILRIGNISALLRDLDNLLFVKSMVCPRCAKVRCYCGNFSINRLEITVHTTRKTKPLSHPHLHRVPKTAAFLYKRRSRCSQNDRFRCYVPSEADCGENSARENHPWGIAAVGVTRSLSTMLYSCVFLRCSSAPRSTPIPYLAIYPGR